ncbi:hypothetical protein RB2654_15290 [Rhodobacterales bacterium HTCC2654]|uniref:Uncharacterized protein n=1 Tax=Maritimibacter alkaliphilus HTCC2654 TaxID=314271 RepID=A3VHA7_9RHOB|nr:hypothetical protein RB2654_15290 [Rhodobacterales bacterium HTCC2654] [Maritimibacter alkaliphilus HTCC2654]
MESGNIGQHKLLKNSPNGQKNTLPWAI